jgi:Uma2 family endonuclease
MSSLAAKSPATYADVLALPAHVTGQIVDGELHTSPRPASPHAWTSSTLGMDVGSAYQRGRGGPGGWWIVFEPELHLGRDVLVPDLVGWRRSRMPSPPSSAFLTVAPDWICEVLSPSTVSLDRVKKMGAYAREGVGHAWLVDPLARTLEVYRLVEDHWLLVAAHEGTETVHAEPFDELALILPDLWVDVAPGA